MNPKLKKIQEGLALKKLDGLILFNPSNIFYLTGFRADNGILFVTRKSMTLAIRELDYPAACLNACCKLKKMDPFNDEKFLKKYRHIKKIGVERDILYEKYKKISSVFGGSISFCDEILSNQRAVKSADEIKKIRAACSLAKRTMDFGMSIARPGITEKELAAEIVCFMRKNGADREAFDTIAAFGSHTACPHHTPTDRKLKQDDIVYIDLGCAYEGYSSDLTRTFFLDRIKKYGIKVHNIVKDAYQRAINAIKPGVVCKDVDSAARDFIAKKGFSKNFIHSTGHGVGIDIHEGPNVSPKSVTVLKENMVLTVEPGIYIPGRFGVRIEDTVLVTKKGCEVLTK